MYKNKTIAVAVPAFNEETQIGRVIETMPVNPYLKEYQYKNGQIEF